MSAFWGDQTSVVKGRIVHSDYLALRALNSEELVGLRQTFHLAGAKTVVSTLWRMPHNEATALIGRSHTDSRVEVGPRRGG